MNFDNYDPEQFFDEFFLEAGTPRPEVERLIERINSFPKSEMANRRKSANAAFKQMGITFSVYGDDKGLEKIFPFDIVPRIISAKDWELIERGVKQRVFALNQFINDIYNDQKILSDGIIPKELIFSSVAFRKECLDLKPPKDIWCHVSGIDLVRDKDGQFYVLEDNLRCPSGVSYVLGNRRVMKQTLPVIFEALPIRHVDDYSGRLANTLRNLIPDSIVDPNIAILTPGIYNSAYFEHSFLAQQMGEELVEGQDLVVQDGFVYMRTTKGFERVHAIYRRIDDEYLDPTIFNPDSLLGVPGIMKSYREGKVALANAPGAGIADDKAIYSFVPKIIKYYTGEEPVLLNVPTYVCENEKEKQHVIDNIENFVVKTTHGSGGYGMLIGPSSTRREQKEMIENIRREPRNYIGQPVIQLSRVPVMVKDHFEGRHVDLRPYVLYGEDIYVLPGGLTRVALKKDSLVVNSSQGGGSKDTWVMAEDSI